MACKVIYDIVLDRIVVTYEDGRVEHLRAQDIRQRALWKDGRHRVEDVLDVREVPVEA